MSNEYDNHERIWLEPGENVDASVGRQWCQDNQWGKAGVEYVRADLVTPAPLPQFLGIELNGVAEQLADGSGDWRSCSGCHNLNEGHPTGPWSDVLKCHLGMGCFECGGIGAVWDNTDYGQVNDPVGYEHDLTECFHHHIRTTIGWLAFGARPGPEMTMYEEGFKAGYRRCQSDNEPELGEEEDALSARARKLVGKLRESIKAGAVQLADVEDAIDLIIDQSTPPPSTGEVGTS